MGIKVMHRLWFGKSLIKLVVPVQDPKTPPAPGVSSIRARIRMGSSG